MRADALTDNTITPESVSEIVAIPETGTYSFGFAVDPSTYSLSGGQSTNVTVLVLSPTTT